MRELYVITESYLDYKGADATNHGVFKTLDDARKGLVSAIKDLFEGSCAFVDNDIETLEDVAEWMKPNYVYEEPNTILWAYDDGDSSYRFYIDKITADI